MDYLKKNNALEPFVKAIEKGDDVMAKWVLLRANKKEIDQVQKTIQDNE